MLTWREPRARTTGPLIHVTVPNLLAHNGFSHQEMIDGGPQRILHPAQPGFKRVVITQAPIRRFCDHTHAVLQRFSDIHLDFYVLLKFQPEPDPSGTAW